MYYFSEEVLKESMFSFLQNLGKKISLYKYFSSLNSRYFNSNIADLLDKYSTGVKPKTSIN